MPSPTRSELVDLHQHIWTEPLLEALTRRDELPFVRSADGVTMLHCASEQPYVIDPEAQSVGKRAGQLRQDGLDRALMAISSPVGIEALPRRSARALIAAHLEGVLSLPDAFGAWGPLALDGADQAEVEGLLGRGCAGVSLAAGGLGGPDRLALLDHALTGAERAGALVFVHPGRAPEQAAPTVLMSEPQWWRALTDYVAQMQAAWLTFAAFGRRRHPTLRIVFAMLAGGAPLLHERLATRGGPPVDLRDPLTFYDTSSFGPEAVSMIAQQVGEPQLVYGSDRPVLEPLPSEHDRWWQSNAGALLAGARAAT